MACKAIQMWTFSALIGSYLDLAIAYSLLCASTAAYFASKFLSVFGLSLPCPCDGVFGHPNDSTNCLQRVLVDSPLQKTLNLHSSVRSKVPFTLVSVSSQNNAMISHLGKRITHEIAEDEASCCSCSGNRLDNSPMKHAHDMHFRFSDSCILEEGNVAESRKSRPGLQRRRRGPLQHRHRSSLSWQDSILLDSEYFSCPTSTVNSDDETSMSCNNMQRECHAEASNVKERSRDINFQDKIWIDFLLNNSMNDPRDAKSAAEGFQWKELEQIGSFLSNKNEKDIIRALESALHEEQAAHANLCLELEKERTAAATAADEAMAMILRLQEEKALIEMEARQYQRMVEEKSTFDAEEMNIMTEILLRREKEKYFLEKEVESYRQMVFANYQNCPPSSGEIQVPALNTQFSTSLNTLSVDEPDIHEQIIKLGGDEGDGSDNTTVDEDLISNSEQPLGIPQISSSGNNIVVENDWKGLDIRRSSSDMFVGFEANGSAHLKNSPSNLRRKSMSSFDSKRMKIDNEVGWLRERLKYVQKGRRRLNFSTASLEGGKAHLKLLEDIAYQLRKIQRLRDPGNAARQASLPPLSSKVRINEWIVGTWKHFIYPVPSSGRIEEEAFAKSFLGRALELLICVFRHLMPTFFTSLSSSDDSVSSYFASWQQRGQDSDLYVFDPDLPGEQ